MNTEKEMMAMTAGELLSLNRAEASVIVERIFGRGFSNGYVTLDMIRHKRITMRHWQLIFAVRRGHGEKRRQPATPFLFGTLEHAVARNFAL